MSEGKKTDCQVAELVVFSTVQMGNIGYDIDGTEK